MVVHVIENVNSKSTRYKLFQSTRNTIKRSLQTALKFDKPGRNAEVQNFLFREHEISSLDRVRREIDAEPVKVGTLFLVVFLLWVTGICIGELIHTDFGIILVNSPGMAFIAIGVGLTLFPYRLLWLPILAFIPALAIKFVLSNFASMSWFDLPPAALRVATAHIIVQFVLTLAMGFLMRGVYTASKKILRPFETDLLLVISAIFIFGGGYMAFNFFMVDLFTTFPEDIKVALGIGDHTNLSVGIRAVQSGVVFAGFILILLEGTDRDSLITAAVLSISFLVLGVMQNFGITVRPEMEALLLASIVIFSLPVRVALAMIIIGVPVYIGQTGYFLDPPPPQNDGELEVLLMHQMGLVLIFIAGAMRTFTANSFDLREGSIKRLNTVRDFANVGVFSISMNTRIVKLDRASKRVFQLPSETTVEKLAALLPEKEQKLFLDTLRARTGSASMLFRIVADDPDIPDHVLRLYLWFETSKNVGSVVYGMVVEVTDEYAREAALQEVNNELSMRQEKQHQMFSIISHELRTPASVIHMLVEDLRNTEDITTTRKQLGEATNQLLTVLADMRQAVNPEKNMPIQLKLFRANQIAESVANSFRIQASENKINLRLEMGKGSSDNRVGDEMRIKQTLSNLVRNAIIHSQAENIWIKFDQVRQGPGGLLCERWEVVDDGIGIPPEQIERLFEPFERGHDGSTKNQDPRAKPDGSGLGLFIVKNSIELLGGTVDHFVPRRGKGTGYRVTMPVRPESIKDYETHEAEAGPKEFDFKKFRLLLAEDNPLVAQVTKARLSRIFGDVHWAENGKAALDAFDEFQPDVIISDLFMPEMDGDEFISSLRSRQVRVPIIGLTAAVVGDDAQRFDVAGADLIMAKPLNMDNLSTFLNKHLS